MCSSMKQGPRSCYIRIIKIGCMRPICGAGSRIRIVVSLSDGYATLRLQTRVVVHEQNAVAAHVLVCRRRAWRCEGARHHERNQRRAEASARASLAQGEDFFKMLSHVESPVKSHTRHIAPPFKGTIHLLTCQDCTIIRPACEVLFYGRRIKKRSFPFGASGSFYPASAGRRIF